MKASHNGINKSNKKGNKKTPCAGTKRERIWATSLDSPESLEKDQKNLTFLDKIPAPILTAQT